MNKINYIEGDLFAGISNKSSNIMIPHVVNCKGAWGAGFVLPLTKYYPNARDEYIWWANGKGRTYVGNLITEESSYAELTSFEMGITQFCKVSDNVVVANMNAQTLGGGFRPLYYNYLSSCMDKVAQHCEDGYCVDGGYEIVAPLFGSGLSQGDWNIVEELITDCWLRKNINVTIYYLKSSIPKNWQPPMDHTLN